MILKENYHELPELAMRLQETYGIHEHEFRLPFIFCPEFPGYLDHIRPHLLSIDAIDMLSERMSDLPVKILTRLDDGLVLDANNQFVAYQNTSRSKFGIIKNIISGTPYYYIKSLPNGNIQSHDMTYNTKNINSLDDFCVLELQRLQKIEADCYLCNKYFYKISTEIIISDSIYLDAIHIFDKRYIMLSGVNENYDSTKNYVVCIKNNSDEFYFHIAYYFDKYIRFKVIIDSNDFHKDFFDRNIELLLCEYDVDFVIQTNIHLYTLPYPQKTLLLEQ